VELFVRGFLRSSLIWLVAGASLGIAMVFNPALAGFRTAHMHANLLGFVSMMIFGVAYHVLPRFTGTPLASRRAPLSHLVAANAGLLFMVSGFITRLYEYGIGSILLRAGAVLSGVGVALFVTNIWRTLDKSARPVSLSPRA
jgi:heme/copper-type cytochrome/quinol oxidase subunit 1